MNIHEPLSLPQQLLLLAQSFHKVPQMIVHCKCRKYLSEADGIECAKTIQTTSFTFTEIKNNLNKTRKKGNTLISSKETSEREIGFPLLTEYFS